MGVEKLLPFDCLNINEFGVMHKNINYNILSYTGVVAFSMKKKSAGDINSLSNWLVSRVF